MLLSKKNNKNEHATGASLELVQNDGDNKSFKMLPELVPSGFMPWVPNALVLYTCLKL